MDGFFILDIENEFLQIIRELAPIDSVELARICQERLEWQEPTTYTVLSKFCQRGILHNNDSVVTMPEQNHTGDTMKQTLEEEQSDMPGTLTHRETDKKEKRKFMLSFKTTVICIGVVVLAVLSVAIVSVLLRGSPWADSVLSQKEASDIEESLDQRDANAETLGNNEQEQGETLISSSDADNDKGNDQTNNTDTGKTETENVDTGNSYPSPRRYQVPAFSITELGSVLANSAGYTVDRVIGKSEELSVPAGGVQFPTQHAGLVWMFPDGSFVYAAPGAEASGVVTDSFQYRARDANGNLSEPITVLIDRIF
jgi:hypothetical protein